MQRAAAAMAHLKAGQAARAAAAGRAARGVPDLVLRPLRPASAGVALPAELWRPNSRPNSLRRQHSLSLTPSLEDIDFCLVPPQAMNAWIAGTPPRSSTIEHLALNLLQASISPPKARLAASKLASHAVVMSPDTSPPRPALRQRNLKSSFEFGSNGLDAEEQALLVRMRAYSQAQVGQRQRPAASEQQRREAEVKTPLAHAGARRSHVSSKLFKSSSSFSALLAPAASVTPPQRLPPLSKLSDPPRSESPRLTRFISPPAYPYKDSRVKAGVGRATSPAMPVKQQRQLQATMVSRLVAAAPRLAKAPGETSPANKAKAGKVTAGGGGPRRDIVSHQLPLHKRPGSLRDGASATAVPGSPPQAAARIDNLRQAPVEIARSAGPEPAYQGPRRAAAPSSDVAFRAGRAVSAARRNQGGVWQAFLKQRVLS